jgi:TolA-binding protein
MKKFLMAAIAVFMMAGTAVAAESVVMVNNNVVTVQSGNAIDKMIALVKGFTKEINEVKTLDELMKVAEKCHEEMMTFEEKYADEVARLEKTLTEAQMEEYEAKLEQTLEELEAAVEKKAEQLMESYDLDF